MTDGRGHAKMPPIMHGDVIIIRLVFTAVLVAAGYILRPINGDPWISAGVGALVAICIILFELRIRRASLKTLIGAAVGSILGIIGAFLIGSLISEQETMAVSAKAKTFHNSVPDLLHGLCGTDGRRCQRRLSGVVSAWGNTHRQSRTARSQNPGYVGDYRRTDRGRGRNRISNWLADHSSVYSARTSAGRRLSGFVKAPARPARVWTC